MIASWELPAAIISGSVAGGGLYLFARELLPATPALGPALGRLQSQAEPATASERMANSLGGWGFVVRHFTIPTKDLAILGMGADAYVSSIVLSTATGYFLPAIVVIVLRIAGYHVSLLLPVGLGLLTGALSAYVAHRDIAKKGAASAGRVQPGVVHLPRSGGPGARGRRPSAIARTSRANLSRLGLRAHH